MNKKCCELALTADLSMMPNAMVLPTVPQSRTLRYFQLGNSGLRWAVVMAQLVERSLPAPKILSSNLGHRQMLFTINCVKAMLNKQSKEKSPGIAQFLSVAQLVDSDFILYTEIRGSNPVIGILRYF